MSWVLFVPAAAQAEAPLSAIDWLSRSVPEAPIPRSDGVSGGLGLRPLPEGEAATVEGITFGDIGVSAINSPSPDAIGLLPAERAGLPFDFWGEAPPAEIAAAIGDLDGVTLPSLRELLFSILLGEFAPPAGSGAEGLVLLARVDKLLDFGALEQAEALIEMAGIDSPALFRRWFDIGLLLGHENAACAELRARPELDPSYPARIFCQARGGDWSAAVLTLRSAEALGILSDDEEEILARFLDPELFENAPPMPPLVQPTPLMWRMMDAIGEPVPTRTLPLAFAHADLRSSAGWKAQIEAAERLSRSGAVTANRLLGLYTERAPAASGGVWDRVAAVQRLDDALTEGAPQAVSAALLPAWEVMADAGLESVLAELYAERLLRLQLDEAAMNLAFRAGLLTDAFAEVAERHGPADDGDAFLIGLAVGDPAGMSRPRDALAEAIAAGFARSVEPLAGAPGLAMLEAIAQLDAGADGALRGVADGIATLRAAGKERRARRAALQLMLLDTRG